ncbi:hypothetical protein MACH17_01760 [Phaeobacter inhibens]|uniref:hypothetical protein n=1 Tax=Phaeobacter inhibens TaxID=221822 RepID=UPI00276CA737|nr:hypothetical protein [Phaeobacter inhibens]GLO68659.1 hypothetical protein MACH17_01760 [Phaeobacter inhibens]
MANASNWDVTVVLDKKPFGQSRELMEASTSAKFVWPATVRSYAEHTKATQFKGEQINQAKAANFKDALAIALAQREPDHILINTPDAFQSVEELGLQDRFHTTFYTHHENLVVPPSEASAVFAQEPTTSLRPNAAGMTAVAPKNLIRSGKLRLDINEINALRPSPLLLAPNTAEPEMAGVFRKKRPRTFLTKVSWSFYPPSIKAQPNRSPRQEHPNQPNISV